MATNNQNKNNKKFARDLILYKLPQFQHFLCCLDIRLGVALLAASGIILDIHIFNASISVTFVCWFGWDTLNAAMFCDRIWFSCIGGVISFINGILYFGLTLPVLACDVLHLLGVIHEIPEFLVLSLYICLPLHLLRVAFVIAAACMGFYLIFSLHAIVFALGIYWWLCLVSIQKLSAQRGSVEDII